MDINFYQIYNCKINLSKVNSARSRHKHGKLIIKKGTMPWCYLNKKQSQVTPERLEQTEIYKKTDRKWE